MTAQPDAAEFAAASGEGAALSPAGFAAIAAIVHADARITLSPAKITLVQSRLARRLREHRLADFDAYLHLVASDPGERAAMVVALTTNHTHFFRERHHFDHFETVMRPRIQAAAPGRAARIWSAGCSSGEEVYSIAMTLAGRDRGDAGWLRHADVKLLATDIAPHVVAATAAGHYAAEGAGQIAEPWRSTWVEPDGEGIRIAEPVRNLVTARVLNLFGDWPMRQKFDAIFCRNVMIYFDDEAKSELTARFAEQLLPGGFLYIGHSERLVGPAATMLTTCGQTIYVRSGDGA